MKIAAQPLTGHRLGHSDFKLDVVVGKPTAHIRNVASGQALGQIVKGYLDAVQCETIVQNYNRNPAVHPRENGVAGETIGVDQFGADPSDYVEQSLDSLAPVNRLFRHSINVPVQLREDIQRIMLAGTAVRPAVFDGIPANPVRGVRWTDVGEFALKLHDDYAQLTDPRQVDMETARVAWPVAFNVYPSVTEAGGELIIFNLAPDNVSRQWLGIAHTGYPYPLELFDCVESITIRPEAGDLVVLSGKFVHGVRGVRGSGSRLLLNHFGGFISADTFVTWS